MGTKKLAYVSKTCVNWTPYPLETDGGCGIGKMPDIQLEELDWDWGPGPKFLSCYEGNPRCAHYIAEGKKDCGRRDHMSKSEMKDWLSRGED